MTQHDTLFIGGEWIAPSSSQTITVVSASTEEVIGSLTRWIAVVVRSRSW
jgi:aldehyde dehydrogenase (NAD+)